MSITVRGTLFYATWCGHCKTFKPQWNILKEEVKQHGGKHGNINIIVDEYEDSNLPPEGAKIQGKDIRGYPTVKLSVSSGGNSIEYEYDGKRTAKDLYHHITEEAIKNIKK